MSGNIEYRAFSNQYDTLKTGIRAGLLDIVQAAFAEAMICEETRNVATNPAGTLSQDNRTYMFLNAVQDHIKLESKAFYKFVEILKREPSNHILADKLMEELEKERQKAPGYHRYQELVVSGAGVITTGSSSGILLPMSNVMLPSEQFSQLPKPTNLDLRGGNNTQIMTATFRGVGGTSLSGPAEAAYVISPPSQFQMLAGQGPGKVMAPISFNSNATGRKISTPTIVGNNISGLLWQLQSPLSTQQHSMVHPMSSRSAALNRPPSSDSSCSALSLGLQSLNLEQQMQYTGPGRSRTESDHGTLVGEEETAVRSNPPKPNSTIVGQEHALPSSVHNTQFNSHYNTSVKPEDVKINVKERGMKQAVPPTFHVRPQIETTAPTPAVGSVMFPPRDTAGGTSLTPPPARTVSTNSQSSVESSITSSAFYTPPGSPMEDKEMNPIQESHHPPDDQECVKLTAATLMMHNQRLGSSSCMKCIEFKDKINSLESEIQKLQATLRERSDVQDQQLKELKDQLYQSKQENYHLKMSDETRHQESSQMIRFLSGQVEQLQQWVQTLTERERVREQELQRVKAEVYDSRKQCEDVQMKYEEALRQVNELTRQLFRVNSMQCVDPKINGQNYTTFTTAQTGIVPNPTAQNAAFTVGIEHNPAMLP